MNAILVLCEGNICRSPMAQGWLATALPTVRIRSAGLGALVGRPADPTAVQLMAERRIDISAHRAQQVTRQLCFESELILVMDQTQREKLTHLYPQVHGRVFKVGEYTYQDIPDPYRLTEQAFRESLAFIDDGLNEWLPRIQKLLKERT